MYIHAGNSIQFFLEEPLTSLCPSPLLKPNVCPWLYTTCWQDLCPLYVYWWAVAEGTVCMWCMREAQIIRCVYVCDVHTAGHMLLMSYSLDPAVNLLLLSCPCLSGLNASFAQSLPKHSHLLWVFLVWSLLKVEFYSWCKCWDFVDLQTRIKQRIMFQRLWEQFEFMFSWRSSYCHV